MVFVRKKNRLIGKQSIQNLEMWVTGRINSSFLHVGYSFTIGILIQKIIFQFHLKYHFHCKRQITILIVNSLIYSANICSVSQLQHIRIIAANERLQVECPFNVFSFCNFSNLLCLEGIMQHIMPCRQLFSGIAYSISCCSMVLSKKVVLSTYNCSAGISLALYQVCRL